MVQALTLYEETPDSRLQALLLPSIVGALQVSVCLAKDALEAFQQKTALYAAGLLRKPDQVRAIVLSCHLFWSVSPERALRPGEAGPVPGRNSKRTLECLQRACVPPCRRAVAR
jgi:vacuolar protein sorting-associated protein 35